MRIRVGFSKPRSWFAPFAWAIQAVEGTPYSHVYVSSYSAMASSELIYQASGTQVNFMGLRHFSRVAQVVKEFEFEISERQYREYLAWAIREAGAPYGVKAVLGIAVQRLFNLKKNPFSDRSKSWFCSELVGVVLRDFVGVQIKDEELESAGPRKIFEICERLAQGK